MKWMIFMKLSKKTRKTDSICNTTVDSLSNKILQPIVTDLFIILGK